MKSYVINDLHFVLVISRIGGIINYLTPKEICFYITDYNFEMKCTAIEQKQARAMIALGLLKIISLSADQVKESFRLFNIYKPKFIPETISSIVVAQGLNLTLVSDDILLTSTAGKELKTRVSSYSNLAQNLVGIVFDMGGNVDLEILNMYI
ncbi:hypothetical protein [Mucilaginibacter jinjuensis]|uniref:Uncharacterized protein n=1 Tax=Mucilaginibacter jinjuensis TaxID=1176721 RepID=A0ABY7T3S2_9SPHI|nr:hypothetical protein [Mucilaginibacter jinjuensis]WCT11026.1 hypothetical protein PQO05_20010 [Mucilaginibacter jinjuensis]